MSDAPSPLLSVRHLSKSYEGRRAGGAVLAVNDVSFDVFPGETLGLVGESGSGKSTIARAIARLNPPISGTVTFEGRDFTGLDAAALRHARRRMQIIFQDPYAALNPRMRVGDFVAEPLIIHRVAGSAAERRALVAELFRKVGLEPQQMALYPHQFSGGQRQRICIARAIALRPSLIIADEPLSSLDVSIQAQIANLLQDLQDELGLSYLLISHDLRIIRYFCHRVAVLWHGRIVELAGTDALFARPRHPYTQRLLRAVPVPDPRTERLRPPVPPASFSPADGGRAPLRQVATGHFVALPDRETPEIGT